MEDMLTMFGTAFAEPETYNDARPAPSQLARLLGQDHFIALAALENGIMIGGLAAYVLDKFEQARKEIYIYDLAVAEPHRRKGAASALIADLQKRGKEIGAYVIFVQADYGDEAAIALYTKLGKREDVMHFDIPVT